MESLTIRQKLNLIFAVLIVVFVSVSIYSTYALNKINEGAMRIATTHLLSVLVASDNGKAMEQYRQLEYSIVTAPNLISRSYAEKKAAKLADQIDITFDALGHIDYICRAAPYDDPEIDYPTFKAEIDAVLKIVTERGKVLELNTRRFYSPRALEELVPVYKKYHDLGGRYVTIGSDAHKVAAIGNYFDRALKFAKELDLTPVTFCQRKLQQT